MHRALRAPRRAASASAGPGARTAPRPNFARLRQPPVRVADRAQLAGQPDLPEARQRRPLAHRHPPDGARDASATARSAPGSSTRTPPATLTKTSAVPAPIPACRPSTARTSASRLRSIAVDDPPRRDELRRRRRAPAPRPAAAASPPSRPARRSRARAWPRSTKRARRVRDLDQAARAHLEDADVVRRAEAVLERPQRPVRALALALELQHAVDQVLEHPRAGERALLGHVADEQHRDPARLRQPRDPVGDLAHLPDADPAAPRQVARVQRLHRVDHAHLGPLGLQRGQHGVQVGLGQHRHLQRRAGQPLGPQPDLRRGLLAGDVERPAPRALEVARAPSTSASTCRCPASRRSAPASRARARRRGSGRARRCRSSAARTRCASTSAQPSGFVAAAQRRRGGPRRADLAPRVSSGERVPLAAAGALAHPARGLGGTGGADEDGGRAGHRDCGTRRARGRTSSPPYAPGRRRTARAAAPARPARPSPARRRPRSRRRASPAPARRRPAPRRVEQHLGVRHLRARVPRPRAHLGVHLLRLVEVVLGERRTRRGPPPARPAGARRSRCRSRCGRRRRCGPRRARAAR